MSKGNCKSGYITVLSSAAWVQYLAHQKVGDPVTDVSLE